MVRQMANLRARCCVSPNFRSLISAHPVSMLVVLVKVAALQLWLWLSAKFMGKATRPSGQTRQRLHLLRLSGVQPNGRHAPSRGRQSRWRRLRTSKESVAYRASSEIGSDWAREILLCCSAIPVASKSMPSTGKPRRWVRTLP
jgi:hypothetical protein